MKNLLFSSTICAALLLFGSAVSGHASIIEFTVTSSAGDLTTTGPIPGASDTVAGIGYPASDTQLYLTTANIFGTSYSGAFVDQIYNGTDSGGPGFDTMTLSGTIDNVAPFTNLTPTTNLVTIVFSAGLTATTTTTSVSVNFPTDVSSITLSGIFAEDLGLSAGTPLSLPTSELTTLIDSATLAGGQPGNYNITTADIVLNSSTAPEPGAWVLMTMGLALVAFSARKKLSRVA